MFRNAHTISGRRHWLRRQRRRCVAKPGVWVYSLSHVHQVVKVLLVVVGRQVASVSRACVLRVPVTQFRVREQHVAASLVFLLRSCKNSLRMRDG